MVNDQNVLFLVNVFSRLILKVLSQYRTDSKVTMVGLRALALLLRSGTRLHRRHAAAHQGITSATEQMTPG